MSNFKPTAWNHTTGIKAKRIAEFDALSHEDWLEVRKKGIGGSDIAAVAGVNPFKSAIDVFLEKQGRLVVQENEKMKWGKILEDPVAREYSDREGVRVNRVKAVLQHPDIPHFQANVDRLIVRNGHSLTEDNPVHATLLSVGNGILEVKTTGWAKAWENGEIPDYNYLQLQWYMHITGLPWGQFAVLVSGQDFFSTPVINYDPKVGKNLAFIADKFWNENVLKNKVPDVDHNPATLNSVKLLYPNVEATECTLPEDMNDLISNRMKLKVSVSTAEKQIKAIDSKILSIVKENKYGLTSKYKVTRVFRSDLKLQSKKFKEENPELFKKYSYANEYSYPLYSEIKPNK